MHDWLYERLGYWLAALAHMTVVQPQVQELRSTRPLNIQDPIDGMANPPPVKVNTRPKLPILTRCGDDTAGG
jgi:hypothetical protein